MPNFKIPTMIKSYRIWSNAKKCAEIEMNKKNCVFSYHVMQSYKGLQNFIEHLLFSNFGLLLGVGSLEVKTLEFTTSCF